MIDTAEAHSDWYKRISKEIGSYKDSLSQKDYKKYKLDRLLRVAGRVDSFSAMCGECQLSQQEIQGLTQNLGNLIQLQNKEERKRYFKKINQTISHLKKQHKLVTEGQYMGVGIAIGVGIGAALGAALDNPSIGTGTGVAIGVAIGAYLDKKAKKEGRVI